MSLFPYAVPALKTFTTWPCQTDGAKDKLINPGPAISMAAISLSSDSKSAILPARSRGCNSENLPRTMAAFVAISPCDASRGGSTEMRERSALSLTTPCLISSLIISSIRALKAAKIFINLLVVMF